MVFLSPHLGQSVGNCQESKPVVRRMTAADLTSALLTVSLNKPHVNINLYLHSAIRRHGVELR